MPDNLHKKGFFNLFHDDRAAIIGERIKENRKRLDLKQTELLPRLYLSTSSVASLRKWERGERVPDLDTIIRMCDVFGCDVGYLLGDYKEADYEKHKVCEYTGLSENAITRLHDMRKYNQTTWYSDILSAVIEHPEFCSLLSYMLLLIKAGEKESPIPDSNHPESVKLRDVYQTRITSLLYEIITDVAPMFEERADYRWLYDTFLGWYRNKDSHGNYHSLSEIQEEMEKNGLEFDPVLFEGERDNG